MRRWKGWMGGIVVVLLCVHALPRRVWGWPRLQKRVHARDPLFPKWFVSGRLQQYHRWYVHGRHDEKAKKTLLLTHHPQRNEIEIEEEGEGNHPHLLKILLVTTDSGSGAKRVKIEAVTAGERTVLLWLGVDKKEITVDGLPVKKNHTPPGPLTYEAARFWDFVR